MVIVLRWKNFNSMLEINILRNSSQNLLGVLKGDYEGLGVQMAPRCPAMLPTSQHDYHIRTMASRERCGE